MPKILAGLVLILCSCSVFEPSYVEVSPYYGIGTGYFNRPVSDFDQEQYGMMFTVGYQLGANRQATNNLAALDVDRSGRLTIDQDLLPQHAAPKEETTTVIVGGPEAKSESKSGGLTGLVPKTADEGKAMMMFALALLLICGLLIGTVFVLKKLGLKVPMLDKE